MLKAKAEDETLKLLGLEMLSDDYYTSFLSQSAKERKNSPSRFFSLSSRIMMPRADDDNDTLSLRSTTFLTGALSLQREIIFTIGLNIYASFVLHFVDVA